MVLGRNVNTDFSVETDITFNLVFELNALLEKAKKYNVEIQKANKNIELSQFDIKINKSNLLPSLNLMVLMVIINPKTMPVYLSINYPMD